MPATPSGETDLAAALEELGRRGITRLLVEGGAILATSLLRADLVDRLAWFRAPSVIGGDGLPALAALGLAALAAGAALRAAGARDGGRGCAGNLRARGLN